MLALRVSVVIIMEFYMENSCEAKGVNLENVFLDKFQEESPDMYAKINDFKVMIRIAEALENTKYYLCLAKHSDGDDVIRKKINSSCIYEFPFLKEILPVQVENT
jgi:hypothetical protein